MVPGREGFRGEERHVQPEEARIDNRRRVRSRLDAVERIQRRRDAVHVDGAQGSYDYHLRPCHGSVPQRERMWTEENRA